MLVDGANEDHGSKTYPTKLSNSTKALNNQFSCFNFKYNRLFLFYNINFQYILFYIKYLFIVFLILILVFFYHYNLNL